MENLIHITFDKAGAANLQQSFALDDIIAGEVRVLEDDLAFGPLAANAAAEGGQTRQQWWNSLMGEEGEYAILSQDAGLLSDLCQQMRTDQNNEIWIWAAQNARDVCGYYALLPVLSDFQGRVYLIYLNNLPFINEKGGIFYPRHLQEILPKEFLKARKLAREITPAEVEVDGEEWDRMVAENKNVRILEGGKKISGEADDYFDKELVNRCRPDYVKGWRLVSQVTQKCKDYIREDFLLARLAFLIANGTLEVKGTYKNMRDAELKAAGTDAADQPLINENDEQQNA